MWTPSAGSSANGAGWEAWRGRSEAQIGSKGDDIERMQPEELMQCRILTLSVWVGVRRVVLVPLFCGSAVQCSTLQATMRCDTASRSCPRRHTQQHQELHAMLLHHR